MFRPLTKMSKMKEETSHSMNSTTSCVFVDFSFTEMTYVDEFQKGVIILTRCLLTISSYKPLEQYFKESDRRLHGERMEYLV